MVRIICQMMVSIVGFTLLFLGFTPVHAAPITVPTGLSPGDQYRLVFVTSGTRDALSVDIGVYNSFVTAEAATSPALLELETQWFAVASTSSVPAVVNTNTQTSVPDVPIYNLAGERVANDYNDLWDGQVGNLINVLIDGERIPEGANDDVWTGTDDVGVQDGLYTLGSPLLIATYGWANFWPEWVDRYQDDTYKLKRMYGISGMLTVPNPVPTPTSLVLLSSGLFGLLGLRRKGRKV